VNKLNTANISLFGFFLIIIEADFFSTIGSHAPPPFKKKRTKNNKKQEKK
jgi:hypothetical protein